MINTLILLIYSVSAAQCQVFMNNSQKTGRCTKGSALYRQYRIILSADTASEGRQLLSQKRRQYFVYWRAFWQRRCRTAAVGAVLEPLGGNYAVLPIIGKGLTRCRGRPSRARWRRCSRRSDRSRAAPRQQDRNDRTYPARRCGARGWASFRSAKSRQPRPDRR